MPSSALSQRGGSPGIEPHAEMSSYKQAVFRALTPKQGYVLPLAVPPIYFHMCADVGLYVRFQSCNAEVDGCQHDAISIGASSYCDGTRPRNVAVAAGSSFTWRSDGAVANAGWTICFAPVTGPPDDGGAPPNTTWSRRSRRQVCSTGYSSPSDTSYSCSGTGLTSMPPRWSFRNATNTM